MDTLLDAVTRIESLCVNCGKNGTSTFLPTSIPHFKDIVICSFECVHCGYKNNEVQSVSTLNEYGLKITLLVRQVDDLDRHIVKSEHASLYIPEIDLEIPPGGQKSCSNTVQGILLKVVEDLEQDQPRRRQESPETAAAIDAVAEKLRTMSNPEAGPPSFTIVIDDPSGSSRIQNLYAPEPDPHLSEEKYVRSTEQLHRMGYYEEQGDENATTKKGADLPEPLRSKPWNLEEPLDQEGMLPTENLRFEFPCPNCGKVGSQNMCEIDIPGFRKCILMAFVCDHCGTKTNEVKPGGAIGKFARRWTLVANSSEDLMRDVLKSDMAGVEIPELELVLEPGTLGGIFTTVEGLLVRIVDEVENRFPFFGDSVPEEKKAKLVSLIDGLKKMAAGNRLPFTLIIDDPADHSHIGRRGADVLFLEKQKGNVVDSSPDLQLKSETYGRSNQQNEDLGLNDMKVDDY